MMLGLGGGMMDMAAAGVHNENTGPGGSPWAKQPQPPKLTTKKSLLEIQEEEARRAAAQQAQSGGGGGGGGAGGGGGWAGLVSANAGNFRPDPPVRTTLPQQGNGATRPGWTRPAAPPQQQQQPQQHARQPTPSENDANFWGPGGQKKSTAPPPRAPSPSPAPPAEFGEAMPPDMAAWCSAELKRIGKNDDLTLMSFLYTVESPAETRQYLNHYLGSSPQVANFASEFIKRKTAAQMDQSNGGGDANGEGGGKKKKKKAGKKIEVAFNMPTRPLNQGDDDDDDDDA